MPCTHQKPVTLDENNKIKKWNNYDNNFINKHWKSLTFIPCKNCIGCKLDYAREWAIRCQIETKKSPHNYFITLTYTTENLTLNDYGIATINQNDLTNFIKKIRKKYGTKIKYLAAAEYGKTSNTQRPHFHIIFFNLKIKSMEPYKKNKIGQTMYISKEIDKCWNKGMHTIAEANYETAGYIARYSIKKLKKIEYKKMEIEPEKLRMSKGIGKEYFYNNIDKILLTKNIAIKNQKGTKVVPIPQFWNRQIKEKMPEIWEKMKINKIERGIWKNEEKLRISNTLYLQNKGIEAHNNIEKLKKLKRNINK